MNMSLKAQSDEKYWSTHGIWECKLTVLSHSIAHPPKKPIQIAHIPTPSYIITPSH